MATRSAKRHTLEYRHRTRSSHQPTTPSSLATKADKVGHYDNSSSAVRLTQSLSPTGMRTAPSPPNDLENKMSSLSAATMTSVAGVSEDFRTKPQRIYQQVTPVGYNGSTVTAPTDAAVDDANGSAGTRCNQLRPNRARTAAIIKAKYIRSVQHYRKLCSLLDMLVAQHGKLEARRRQLQRTMSALSAMYRMNTIRTLGTTNTGTLVVSSPSIVSSSTSPVPPQHHHLAQQRSALQTAGVEFRRSAALTLPDCVIDVDSLPEGGTGEYEAELMQTSTLVAEDLSGHGRWCIVDDIDATPIGVADQQPVELSGRQRCSPPTTMMMASDLYSRGGGDDDSSFCGRDVPMSGTHWHPSYQSDSERITEAHCKNTYIDINVDHYERPAAAHTRKADLSSYSYLQLSRQRPV